MKYLFSTNPANNYALVGKVVISSHAEVSEKVKKAQTVKKAWKAIALEKRIALLTPICEEFARRGEELAKLITQETGKPIQQSRNEAKGYVEEFRWFMDHVGNAVGDEITYEDKKSVHKIVFEPIGVSAVITPWNFPFGMAIWGIIPNILVGNPVVFKISEECPLVGKFIEEVMNHHNLPEGIFSEVYGAGEVGKQLAESNIDFIWFTGSTNVGKVLYKIAARKFIKVLLEMGGSNPCIVFDDVDISQAAQIIYSGRFQNCGQVCDATKRLIVHKSIAHNLVTELQSVLAAKHIGNPMDKKTDISSLVAQRQCDLLKEQVHDALAKGAEVIAQMRIPDTVQGAFYPPTILGNITTEMKVWKEEVFGPVLPMITFETEQEAITLANDTPYGLGSRVMSQNNERAQRVALHIEAGTVEVNQGDRWLSCNPFGGYKNSGMGREHGIVGFKELCQMKVISSSK